MFTRWRCQLQVKGRLAYVSHLDILSALERSLRRAELSMRFSEGFNPHMQIAFGPAHAVGVEENALWCDLDFQDSPPQDWPQRLQRVLPEGLFLAQAREIATTEKSLTALLNLAVYELEFAAGPVSVEQFMAKDSHIIERVSPKGHKTMDIRPPVLALQESRSGLVEATVRLCVPGSPKPKELAAALAPDLPLVALRRCGLFIDDEQGRRLP